MDKSTTKASKKTKAGSLQITLQFILFLVIGLVASSYISTRTLDFNGQSVSLWKMYRKYHPSDLVITAAELRKYDGSDPKLPIYLAINGKVYDVTAGRSYYGPGGSYSFFSGRDAARAYITGCFETHLTHDLRGLTEAEVEGLSTWTSFYEKSKKYFYVGDVLHADIDPDSPIPEPCKPPSNQ